MSQIDFVEIIGDFTLEKIQKHARRFLEKKYGSIQELPIMFCPFNGDGIITQNTAFVIDVYPIEKTFMFASQPGRIFYLGVFDPEKFKKNRIRPSDLSSDINEPPCKKIRIEPIRGVCFPSTDLVFPDMEWKNSDLLERCHEVWLFLKLPHKFFTDLEPDDMFIILLCHIARPNDPFPHLDDQSRANMACWKSRFSQEILLGLPTPAKKIIEYLAVHLP